MSAPRVRLRSGVGPLLLVAGVLLGVLLWAGMAVVGPAVALLPMALVICWWLFWHPLPSLMVLASASTDRAIVSMVFWKLSEINR